MATFFLIIIYITFISLGLPDSLLGSAWTVMRLDLGADLSAAGIISMVISGSTIISSLISHRLINRFKTGMVTAFSVLLTAIAILGISIIPSFWWFVVLAVPLGLGGGSVDTALNNYVATHYKPHHMSWLHSFWGVGAFSGPLIMANAIQNGNNWRGGYLAVGIVQISLAVILFITLPLWLKREPKQQAAEETETKSQNTRVASKTSILRVRGVFLTMLGLFAYCGIESVTGVWGASYLVEAKNIAPATAARWISGFFMGITLGRFLTGFLTMKLSGKILIRLGQLTIVTGAIILVLPLPTIFSLFGIALIGFGCAPIFPCILHETPERFGEERSQQVMGIQMACAYTGATFLPPIFGLIASKWLGVAVWPFALLLLGACMFIAREKINSGDALKD